MTAPKNPPVIEDDDDLDLPRIPAALHITTPADYTRERTPFQVDDELLWAIRPKGGQLLGLIRTASESMTDFEEARVIDQFIEMAMEPDTAARLRERLDDPDDGFDIEHLTSLMQ